MKPVRKVRRFLAEIDHNSASSTKTVWSSLMGWNLLLSIVLGFPCALLLDRLVVREFAISTATGRLFRQSDDKLAGVAMDLDSTAIGWQQLRPYGEFKVTLKSVSNGWPAASHDSPRTVQTEVIVIDPRKESPDLERDAILKTLRTDGRTKGSNDRQTIVSTLERSNDKPHFIVWAFVFNSLVSAPVLYAIGSLVIGFFWVIAMLLEQRSKLIRRTRLSRGLCPRCCHSVEGNMWSGRCPECGEKLYPEPGSRQ